MRRPVFVRELYVKVNDAPLSNVLRKMDAKLAADGIENMLESRKRYIKPTQQRQLNKKSAIYNNARRERERVVEAALADPALTPF